MRAAAACRYQDQRERRQAEREPDMMTGRDIAAQPAEKRLRGLEFRVRLDGAVAYHDAGDILRGEVMRDEGSRIVLRQQSDETTAAVLRLAACGGAARSRSTAALPSKSARCTSRSSSGSALRNGELQGRQHELVDRRRDVERQQRESVTRDR